MITVGMHPSEGAHEPGACSSHRDREIRDSSLAAAAKVQYAVERKQYPGSRGTVFKIVRDTDVMSNEVWAIAVWAGLAGSVSRQ